MRPRTHRRRTASVFVSLVTRRKELLQRNARHRLAEFLDLRNHAIQLGLTAIGLRYDAGNRLAVSGDDDGLTALDRVEKAGQLRLGLGRLDFAHDDGPHILTSQS